MAEFQEFPKMLYHDSKAPRVVKTADEQTQVESLGYKTQAPSQFEDESSSPSTANMPDQNADPTREPAIVSQLEQEKTRLAGNMGAKDPAQLLADEENGDENSEDLEPIPAPKSATKKGK